MEPEIDSRLLQRFSAEGDEAAFTGLVERYAPMVRGAALRCTEDLDTAEEVTQNVFAILARKASSVPPAQLAGWLYNTAYLEARNAGRKAARYRRALNRLSNHTHTTMDNSAGSPPGSTPWEDIRPHLDEALLRLPEKVRKPIMLRFFEKRSVREIAAATGKTEHASRKELERSLQRLGMVLQKRGVFASGAALSVMLAGRNLCAPPASAAALASAALKIAPTLSSASLLKPTVYLMTATQTTKIAAVVILAAIPATIFWRQKSDLEEEVRSLRAAPHISQVDAAKKAVSPIGNKPAAPRPEATAEKPANPPAGMASAFTPEAMLKRAQDGTIKDAAKELARINLNLPDLTESQKAQIKGALEKRNREKLDGAVKAFQSGALARLMSDPKNVSPEDKAALAALDPTKAEASLENDPLEGILTEEQFAVYTAKKEEKRVSDAETSASDALKSLGRDFDLSAEQKDQIFQALAQQQLSPSETSEAGQNTPFAGFGEREEARDQVIRQNLTPEQAAIFDKSREEEKRGREQRIKSMIAPGQAPGAP